MCLKLPRNLVKKTLSFEAPNENNARKRNEIMNFRKMKLHAFPKLRESPPPPRFAKRIKSLCQTKNQFGKDAEIINPARLLFPCFPSWIPSSKRIAISLCPNMVHWRFSWLALF
jgi:hypothetical protein